jgi:large subunit ribosomal protein L1
MVTREEFKTALEQLLASSPKRNFVQSVDVVFNLQNIDLKKPEQHIDLFIQTPHARGKEVKVACFCAPELLPSAKENCDLAISIDEFEKYEGKKTEIKKLANGYDFFLAQATIMPQVAKTFGRVFGPKGKMPNPKAGAVVPGNANLEPVVKKFGKTVRLLAKAQPSIKAHLGRQDQPQEELLDNAMAMYNSLIKKLPQEDNNIKNILIKLTMSSTVPVGKKAQAAATSAPAAPAEQPKEEEMTVEAQAE